MSSSEFLATPKPVPNLNIPKSLSTVKVSVIDSYVAPLLILLSKKNISKGSPVLTYMQSCPSYRTARLSLPFSHFLTPTLKGKERIGGPAYSTLIEHPSGRKVLFDLGVRKDWENMAPKIVETAKKAAWSIKVEKNVAEILEENGLRPADIEAIIWSHYHFDQ